METTLHRDIERVMYDADTLRTRCSELGAEISRSYEGRPFRMITVLKGAFVFVADLARHVQGDVSMDFIAVSSYGASTESSGTVRITKDLQKDLFGIDALIVEDIVDTGLTLQFLLKHLQSHQPRSLKVCSLLSKPSARKVEVPVDYCGFEVPPEFVVGYGLDFDERYRELPYIGILRPEAYAE